MVDYKNRVEPHPYRLSKPRCWLAEVPQMPKVDKVWWVQTKQFITHSTANTSSICMAVLSLDPKFPCPKEVIQWTKMIATYAVDCGATEALTAQGTARFVASSKQGVPFPQRARDLRAEAAVALTHLVSHVTSYMSCSGQRMVRPCSWHTQ